MNINPARSHAYQPSTSGTKTSNSHHDQLQTSQDEDQVKAEDGQQASQDDQSTPADTQNTTHHHRHHASGQGQANSDQNQQGQTSPSAENWKGHHHSFHKAHHKNTSATPNVNTPSPDPSTPQPPATATDPIPTVTDPTTQPPATTPPTIDQPGTSNSTVKLGVPAYSDTGSQGFWSQVQNAKPGSVFIMNPNSGPGQSQDAGYKAAVDAAHAKGVKVYGYVSTQYGQRSPDAVNQDISAYKSMYGVDGIFLDEAALDKSHLSYYQNISDSLHQSGLEVGANPGQPDIDPSAVNFTDHIMNFEGSYADYQKAQFPEWTKSVSPDKFWNVIYAAPSNVNVQDLLNTAQKNHVGMIYATDDSGTNPWDNVPSFFSQELSLTA